MIKIENEKLDIICGGGVSFTGTLVSALTDVIKMLYDAGHAVGSSVRRVKEKELCPIND